AIIRKGGLGTPVVISVILFIIYYIIDNTGYKMAREGLWQSYQGMWLSSAVLLPIGIFLTYVAVVDASLFNTQEYIKIWNIIKRKFGWGSNQTTDDVEKLD
ncbi:MAG: LptF/LptG family permease, partial [Paludibacter sp.]